MGTMTDMVLASDAFFPFPTVLMWRCWCFLHIIQPGGSVADVKVIEAVDKYGMYESFTWSIYTLILFFV